VVAAAVTPLVVLLLATIAAWRKANKLAKRDFFAGFALTHGLTYTEKLVLMETTPLLGAGDRRHCTHYMEGPLSDDLPGIHAGLSHYKFETLEERDDSRRRAVPVYTPHEFTICVVELERAMTTFPGIFLTKRGGLFGEDSWLEIKNLKTVELESSALASRYKLLMRPNQDRTRLLELFQPSFQVWLSGIPIQIFFEFSGGTLVTYVPKRLNDLTSLEILLQSTAKIAKRILSEGEPLRAVDGTADDTSSVGSRMPPVPYIEPVPDLPPAPPARIPPGAPPAAH
jgi:hypothetical protein